MRLFLVLRTQLYKLLCRSVGWLARLSVRWSLIAWSTQLMAIGLVSLLCSSKHIDAKQKPYSFRV